MAAPSQCRERGEGEAQRLLRIRRRQRAGDRIERAGNTTSCVAEGGFSENQLRRCSSADPDVTMELGDCSYSVCQPPPSTA
jgi:hypothetical protein